MNLIRSPERLGKSPATERESKRPPHDVEVIDVVIVSERPKPRPKPLQRARVAQHRNLHEILGTVLAIVVLSVVGLCALLVGGAIAIQLFWYLALEPIG
jgi:hypothetical protein